LNLSGIKSKKKDSYRNVLTWKEIWIIVEFLGIPDPVDGIDPLKYNSIIKLADLYKVERRTFSRWLAPLRQNFQMDNPKRNLFTPREVKMIIDHLGLPGLT
jgi:hypothetical protein